jgi:multimeric flavodoxin WrbA
MQITAVIGSYHKGRTLGIVRRIEEHMKRMGDVTFNYIYLSEMPLAQCRGCFVCIGRGEEKCPLKDSFADIDRALMESDGAIFASPNYAVGATALMKQLIERYAYVGHRPKFFGKYMLAVSTSGGPMGLKQTLSSLAYFAGGGFEETGRLGVMTPPTKPSAKAEAKLDRRIENSARKLYDAIAQKRTRRPNLGSSIQFAAFRGMYMSNPALGEAEFPADMAYWHKMGWLDKKSKSFSGVNPQPLTRFVGWLFEKVIGAAAKGMKPEREKD